MPRLFEAGRPFFDQIGSVLSAGTVDCFGNKTTTPANIYTDAALTVAAANPVVLDSSGRFPSNVYVDPTAVLTVVAKDTNGATMWSRDNVRPSEARGGESPTYNTYALARAANFSDGDTVTVLGRSAVGDGGGGFFQYVANATTDYTTELAADEVTAAQGDGGVYVATDDDKAGAVGVLVRLDAMDRRDARWYGAALDGATNDQAAIDAAVSGAAGTSAVLVVNGPCKLTTLPSDLSLFVGDGYFIDGASRRVPFGPDFRARAISAQRPVPASSPFSYLTILPTFSAVGNVHPSEQVADYARRVYAGFIGIGSVYVDRVNGNDANPGTMVSPVKTIDKACADLAPGQIYLVGSNDAANPALFDYWDFRATDAQGTKLKIITALGHCRIIDTAATVDAGTSDALDSVTWSANGTYPAVYEFPRTNLIPVRAVLFKRWLDSAGRAMRVPVRTSLADVNSSGFGWYDDGSKVYLRIKSENIESIKAELHGVFSETNSRCLFLGTKISLEAGPGSSLTFQGVRLAPLQLSGARAELFAQGNITIEYCAPHGIDALGSDIFLQDVDVFASQDDNIHYYDDGGVACRGLEINVTSEEAGDVATYESAASGTNNGSSMHDTGSVAYYGGVYKNNNGPNIIGTGTGAFWCVGSRTYGSTGPSNAWGFAVGSGTMYLDSVIAAAEDDAAIYVDTGAVLRTFSVTGDVTENGTGETVPFDPINPY